MVGTILQQGRFTSEGTPVNLNIRSDVDWMYVYNKTVLTAAGAGTGAQFYWQRGMAAGEGIEYKKTAATNALQIGYLTSGGFTLLDTGDQALGVSIAISGATNATQPVVSTANTGSLSTGSVVRLFNVTGATDLEGIDFEVDTVVANTSFRIRYALATAPGAAGTAGQYRQVKVDPIFYPRRRFIANITKGSTTTILLTVTHQFTVGQVVRVSVPQTRASGVAIYGMTEINNLTGTITAINTSSNTITLDIDSSSFTTFTFPTAAQAAAVNMVPAFVSPVGEDTAVARANNVSDLDDATNNVSIIGMQLAAGVDSPAGVASDVIYWVAGSSTRVDQDPDLNPTPPIS